LADLYWFQNPDEQNEEDLRYSNGMDIEDYFCISTRFLEYYPSSVFQTPIFQLLRFAPKETIDFILSFTNKIVECYAKSELKNEVEEVEVFINEKETKKQYISNRLWNTYRGTQVSTHLLESIHMALEKWLLENAKSESKENLECWCLYLIKNSKSASITAVVTSVVLAKPSKLFNIAKILFQTKEFFFYDTNRIALEVSALAPLGSGIYGRLMQNERSESNKLQHRQMSLEHLALYYQFFKTEEESNKDVEERQKILWAIFDKYYGELTGKSKETESDKTWRLCLARMDRRKMHPEVEKKDGQFLIKFNPEIESELKKYSEESLQKSSGVMKYTSLRIWSDYRFKKEEDKYKQYQQYENNPQLAITETKEIIEGLKKEPDKNFSLFNRSIPAYTCSVLIRDYYDKLNEEDKEFCKKIIIAFASIPLKEHYQYQVSDGTEPTIISLPELFKDFPKDRAKIKSLLFLLLLSRLRVISTFAVHSVFHNLWGIDFKDAHSIFLGYLLLKPKYDNLWGKVRKKNYKKAAYEVSENQVIEVFIKRYKNELERIVSNKIIYDDLGDLSNLDLETLKTAFELLPLRTKNEDHKKFIITIFPIFSKKLFLDDGRIDDTLKQQFLEKFAYFILTSTKEEIEIYLKPFIENFVNSRDMADFFQEFIAAENTLNQYEEFWIVWNAFYDKIVEIIKNKSSYHYISEIIHNYLLARRYWEEDAKEWHTLKEREKLFFKKVAENIGYHPSVLYSLSKVLNDIGSKFLDDGIAWISNVLKENKELLSEELETNTIYYIENIVRRYIFANRQKIKTTLQIKNQVVVILNFLIERGSITGYLLREDIL
jgi:hypothetical protein